MIGVLIVNLGTPDSPSTPDVRKYLREFLMDGRVIDFPFIPRWLLVNLIIAPFRAPKSAKIYKEVWTEQGSPLKVYGYEVERLLKEVLPANYEVKLAMRYQSPSIDTALTEFKGKGYEKIIVLPMFPQYASASTGSVQEKVMEIVSNWQTIPSISFISNFYDNELFLDTITEIAKKHIEKEKYDHFLFSYHGIPERHIRKGDCSNTCLKKELFLEGNHVEGCCKSIHKDNQYCYRAQCFATTRLLRAKLGLLEENCSTTFQSRLGRDPWIKPYTDDVIKQFDKKGYKKVLAFSPSFVSDCLETTIEVGDEYKEIFEEYGGEHWQLVESLNDHPTWIKCMKEMICGEL